MRMLNLRIPKRLFVEDLVEEMTRETWAILRRAAPANAAGMGSFVGIRGVLRDYLWRNIRAILPVDGGSRVFMLDMEGNELEVLAYEATAAVMCDQEPLVQTFRDVDRVAARISLKLAHLLRPFCGHPEAASVVARFRGGAEPGALAPDIVAATSGVH